MANLAIQRALGQRRANVFERGQASSGLETFAPEDFPDGGSDIPWYQSVGAAIRQSGIITGGVAAIADDGATLFAPRVDTEYDIGDHILSTPAYQTVINEALTDPENPNSAAALMILMEGRNAQHTDDMFRRLAESEERTKIAQANGTLPEVLGFVAGIGIDIGATLLLLLGTAGIASVATPSVGAAVVTRAGLSGGRAALVGAGRIAALAAAEGAAERGIQKLTDPLIPTSDIWLAAGFGAVFGGALGAIAPHRLAGVQRIIGDNVVERAPLGDNIVAARRAEQRAAAGKPAVDEGSGAGIAASGGAAGDAGAAVSPGVDTTVAVPGKGAGSLVARFVPFKAGANVLRNLKRVITDIGVRGNKQFQATGLLGNRKLYDQFTRLLRFSIINQDEVGGRAGRRESATEFRLRYDLARRTREDSTKRQYAEAVQAVFDLGTMARILRNNDLKQIGKRGISQEEFEQVADEFAIAQARGRGDAVDIWGKALTERTTAEQREALMPFIKAHAAEEDAFYTFIGQVEVDLGILKADQLIPGYRPQRWNKHEIELNRTGFENYLMDILARNPDDEWLRARGWITEEETWDAIRVADVDRRNDIIEDWSRVFKSQLEDRKFLLLQVADEKRIARGEKSIQEIQDTTAASTAKDYTLLATLEERLAQQADDAGQFGVLAERSSLAVRIGKVEKRIADKEAKLRHAKADVENIEELEDLIRRVGNNAQRKATKVGARAVAKAERANLKATESPDLQDTLDKIIDAMTDQDATFGILDGEFIQNSSRFKRRAIHLEDSRHTEAGRKFLLTNAHDARQAYISSVGTQLALRQAFGVTPELLQGSKKSLAAHLRREFLEGFKEDLKRGDLNDKARAAVKTDQDNAGELFDKLFAEFTHSDIVLMNRIGSDINAAAGIVNTLTAAMSLGNIAFSLVGDLAVMLMAGGRIGTGFTLPWRSGASRKIIEEIFQGGEGEIATLAQGLSVLDASRFRAVFELDMPDFDIPGGMLRTVARKIRSLAVLEGWANLMHVWNRVVRGGFGLDFMRQMDADFAKYDTLPKHLKSFYAKQGIDSQDAKDIAAMLNRSHKKFVNGALRVPDSAVWGREAPDLLAKYKRAVQSAGDEAMIDPSVGDRPFLRSFPGGRMVMQFQSFMFTAGERFIAPMIQEFQMHPTSIRPYLAAWMGIQLGIMSDGLRAVVRGDGDEWLDRWDTFDGTRDNLSSGILRSPMMAGPTAAMAEVVMQTFGRVLNDQLEKTGAARLIPEGVTRFREGRAPLRLLGPAFGQFLSGITVAKKFAEGDFQKAIDMTVARTPLFNTFYIQTLLKLGRGN